VSLWKKRFEKVIEYKQIFGNCTVPVPYKITLEMGEFVRTYRILHEQKKKGNNDMLSDEEID